MRKLTIFAAVTLAGLLFPSPLHSQNTSRSDLRISLTDQAGNVIVESLVRLVTADGGERKGKTNDEGVAMFRGLPLGKYTVHIKVEGFKSYTSDLILMTAGETKRLDIAMQLGEIQTTVNVDPNEAVDMDGIGQTRPLGQDQIDQLPTDPQEMARVLQRIAGESPTGEAMGITVNGVPGGQMPAKEDIKLIRVNRNVFSAQYEGTSGGGIEIFTNSGNKKIGGWISYNISDSRWGAADPFLGVRVPSRTHNFFGGMRGPIGKKTSFNLFTSRYQTSAETVVNATVLNSSFQPVSLRASYAAPVRSERTNVTVDSDPTKKHKLLFGYTLYTSRSQNAGVGGFTLAERGNRNERIDHQIVFTDTYIRNPNVVNTTRLSGQIFSNVNAGSILTPAINVQDAFFGGGSQLDSRQQNYRFELYNDTTKKVNRWNFTFGGMIRGLSIADESRSNFGGTYTFTGRTAPALDAANNIVTDTNGNPITTQITSIESYRRTLLFRSLGYTGAQIRSLGGGPDQFSIAGGRPDIAVKQFEFAGYGQANFSLTETVGLSFGVRYENQTNISDGFNFGPRFGVVWQPKTREKQKPITVLPRITVGAGFFYSRFSMNNTLNVLQSNDTERSFFFITDRAILDLYPSVPDIASLQQSKTLRSLRQINNGLRTPQQAILNVSATKPIWLGISLSASYTHTEAFRQGVTRNINAPLAGTFPLAPIYPSGNNRNIQEYQSGARNRIERFGVGLNFPQWKLFHGNMYMGVNYNFMINRGNAVSGSGSRFDPYDFSHEWGPNTRDGFHSFNGYISLPLPLGIFANAHWEVSSGIRYNIYTGRDSNGDGFYSERPSFATDPNKPGIVATPYGLLDPNPGAGDRLIPRNIGVAPMTRDFNLGLSRSFGFDKNKADKNKPRKWFSLRMNVDNLFNFNNRSAPVGNMASPFFLRSTSGFTYGGGPGTSQQRRISFGTSFSF